MNVMQKAHTYAREHRGEFATYRVALSEGLRVAHREAKAARGGGALVKIDQPNFRPVDPRNFAENSEAPQVDPTATTKKEKVLYQAQAVPADKAAAIIAQGVEKYRNQVRPFLLRDWKSPDYDGREVFRRGVWR